MKSSISCLGRAMLRPTVISLQSVRRLGASFHRPSQITRLVCRSSATMSNAQDVELSFHDSGRPDLLVDYAPPLLQSEERMKERVNQLKKDVIGMFEACEDVVGKLNLVDAVQRLGIDHHFEDQIISALEGIHTAKFNSTNLHEVSLRFRLLRQKGFLVTPDVFTIFRNEDGTFKSDIANDPKSLLSLYNAANLRLHNERLLEEALIFARNHLELVIDNIESPLVQQVSRALQIPLPRTLKRVEALSYMSEFKQEQAYNPSILELATLDFNLHQILHRKEIKIISKWWAQLSRHIELDYVRDHAIGCYFCAYAIFYEQEHERARIMLTKLSILWTILDDTYDMRATLDDSRLLNEAIQRWDDDAVSILPEYLKKYFISVMGIFRDFEDELEPHHKYRGYYLRKAFQTISSCYLQEAEWFHKNYTPSLAEKAYVSAITGGGQIATVSSLFGMGDMATKDSFEWAIGLADAVRASGEMVRYMNDMAGYKDGGQGMDTANSVACYAKENHVTDEDALAQITAFVEDGWKTINEAPFKHGTIFAAAQLVSNYTMCCELYFQGMRDAYTHNEELKETIKAHFFNPVPLFGDLVN